MAKKTVFTRAQWASLNADQEEQLLHLVAPHVRWLAPPLVKAVAAANAEEPRASNWASQLRHAGIEPRLYLWPGSACAYPGVRRRVGDEKRSDRKSGQALFLDKTGNTYAKKVWYKLINAFDTLRNGYHLVHLFPHKGYVVTQLIDLLPPIIHLTDDDAKLVALMRAHGLPGLFTNPANMCYLPGNLTRPTDANTLLQRALWHRAITLYGANALLPPVLAPLAERFLNQNLPADIQWDDDFYGEANRLPSLLLSQESEFLDLMTSRF